MDADEVIRKLTSSSLGVRTTATYQLGYKEFWNPGITHAVRTNLDADDADLVEITIMRLLVRGKDVQSADRVRSVFTTSRDDLVVRAAIGALTNLARDFPETALATLEIFEAMPRSRLPADLLAFFDKSVRELRRLSA
ncbi:hypothetical protein [Qipengyuania mesophila]|uniref:hypothetical protein n=1 Tax=Qipengyuania mesophila TaxID=2867246 RepID=UPI003512A931